MVRLITHNLLACHAKGCTSNNNFPLVFKDAKVEIREADFNEDFLRGFIPRIDWPALVSGARDVSSHFLQS
jgi:multifunctional methyltransferase subunit TRM112